MSKPVSKEKPKAESDAPQAETPEGLKGTGSSAKTKLVAAGSTNKTEAVSSTSGDASIPGTGHGASCARKLLIGVSTAVLAASVAIPLLAHTCCNNEDENSAQTDTSGKTESGQSPYGLLMKLLGMVGFSSDRKPDKDDKREHRFRDVDDDVDQSASDYATTQSL